MAGITNQNPLLRTEAVQAVFDAWIPQAKKYPMRQYYPVELSEYTLIKIDEKSPLNYGLVKASQPGAESPIIRGGSMKQYQVAPIHFREKIVYRYHDLVGMRRMGTEAEIAAPNERIVEGSNWLRGRVEDRIEWMCWQATAGRIAINENNVSAVYNYSLPAHMNVTKTGTARWDAATTCNPLNDIMEMLQKSIGYGWRFGSIWMNSVTAKYALQTDQFRNFYRDCLQGGIITGANIATMDVMQKILQLHIPQMPQLVICDDGYYVEVATVQHANTGGFSVVVDEDLYFEQNDTVTLVSKDTRDTQLMTLNGGPVSKQLNFLTPLTAVYKEGSAVRCFKQYIPNGRVYFMPEIGGGMPSLGKVVMTPTEWAPGQLTAPKAGVFFEVHEHLSSDPKRIEVISGFEGIAYPQYQGMHAIMNVF